MPVPWILWVPNLHSGLISLIFRDNLWSRVPSQNVYRGVRGPFFAIKDQWFSYWEWSPCFLTHYQVTPSKKKHTHFFDLIMTMIQRYSKIFWHPIWQGSHHIFSTFSVEEPQPHWCLFQLSVRHNATSWNTCKKISKFIQFVSYRPESVWVMGGSQVTNPKPPSDEDLDSNPGPFAWNHARRI